MKQFIYILTAFLISMPTMAVVRTNAYFETNATHTKESATGGVDEIFIFKSLLGSTLIYNTPNATGVAFYTYENSLADKRPLLPPITITPSDGVGGRKLYTISNLPDNIPVVVVDNNQTKIVWVIDYSMHLPKIIAITPTIAEDNCEVLKLQIDKNDALEYRGQNGEIRRLERKYSISYDILEWSKDDESYIQKTHTDKERDIGTEILLEKVPNMDTYFTLKGDQYAVALGVNPELSKSNLYQAISVEANMIAQKTERDSPTEQKEEGEELGGSAPVEIKFLGFGNKPTAHFYTWYVYDEKDMKNPVARFNDEDMDYIFQQAGNYKAVLEVANESSTCVDSASVVVKISVSDLKIPNFFSPRSSPGSNDEFRVSYKSLIKFRMSIVNRWGNKIFETSDPAQGWDGRYKGRMVNPGVYFYRIEATGSDNIRYNEAGDINLL